MSQNQFCVSKTVEFSTDSSVKESFFIENKGNLLIGFVSREELVSLQQMIEAATRINEKEVKHGN